MQMPRILDVWVYGPAKGTRRTGKSSPELVPDESISEALYLFCGRRKSRIKGLFQEGEIGFCATVQTTGRWRFLGAEDWIGSERNHDETVSVAYGRLKVEQSKADCRVIRSRAI